MTPELADLFEDAHEAPELPPPEELPPVPEGDFESADEEPTTVVPIKPDSL